MLSLPFGIVDCLEWLLDFYLWQTMARLKASLFAWSNHELMLLCVLGWRGGSVFVETSAQWSRSKEVDKKATVSTERSPVDIDLPQVFFTVTCLLLWPAQQKSKLLMTLCAYSWCSWGSHEKPLKWNMHRCISICQPAIKFSYYIVWNCRFKITDIHFLLLQPSL